MASIQKRAKNSYLIQFYDRNGKHRGISLSGVSKKSAEDWGRRVDILNGAKRSGYPIDGTTADWLNELGDIEAAKLVKVGLIEPRAVATLGDFLAEFFKSQEKEWAPRTRQKHNTTRDYLLEFFKPGKMIRDITEADADAYCRYLRHDVPSIKSEATRMKYISNARVYLSAAVRKRLISTNPFAHIKVGAVSRDEYRHVTREEARAILDACPNSQWRLIFAFARYGGLRIPSELNGLEWSHILWDQGKILIHAPKTKRHRGKDKRFIPMFPELKTCLDEEWDRLDGSAGRCVITEHRKPNGELSEAYLRKRMRLIIEKAGVTPWDKLFQNCRSTRETELADQFPEHVACAWIGNSLTIARKHYLNVTDDHFTQATGGPMSSPASSVSQSSEPQGVENSELMTQVMLSISEIIGQDGPAIAGQIANVLDFPTLANIVATCQNDQIGRAGLEPATKGL